MKCEKDNINIHIEGMYSFIISKGLLSIITRYIFRYFDPRKYRHDHLVFDFGQWEILGVEKYI